MTLHSASPEILNPHGHRELDRSIYWALLGAREQLRITPVVQDGCYHAANPEKYRGTLRQLFQKMDPESLGIIVSSWMGELLFSYDSLAPPFWWPTCPTPATLPTGPYLNFMAIAIVTAYPNTQWLDRLKIVAGQQTIDITGLIAQNFYQVLDEVFRVACKFVLQTNVSYASERGEGGLDTTNGWQTVAAKRPRGFRRYTERSKRRRRGRYVEDQLLLDLRESSMPWKDIAAHLQRETGKQYKLSALQMRLKRLQDQRRILSEQSMNGIPTASSQISSASKPGTMSLDSGSDTEPDCTMTNNALKRLADTPSIQAQETGFKKGESANGGPTTGAIICTSDGDTEPDFTMRGHMFIAHRFAQAARSSARASGLMGKRVVLNAWN